MDAETVAENLKTYGIKATEYDYDSGRSTKWQNRELITIGTKSRDGMAIQFFVDGHITCNMGLTKEACLALYAHIATRFILEEGIKE